MELLPGLLALQLVVIAAAFTWLWRRQQRLNGELQRLRAAFQELQAHGAPHPRRAAGGELDALIPIGADAPPPPSSPKARAARAWKLSRQEAPDAAGGPILSADTARGLTLALMATLPAFGLFFGADEAALASTGLAIAAAMMMIALRRAWSAAAWSAVLTAAAWALIGFARGAAHAEPASYAVCVALAAAAGLIHARMRDATSGASMAFTMGAAALALASQTGMVGPAGAAFAAITASAAVIGATSLRLESLHLAAFVAALIGLFVLSGQESAAIWFTPAASLMGALFFAIAVIRVPQLGLRGATLAGTGALAPFAAIAALYAAQHGLADRISAAGAYLALAALLSWLVLVSKTRDNSAAAPLGLTLWVLMLGVFAAASNAVVLALPPPAAAPSFAALGLGLAWLNLRSPDAAWRTFGCAAGVLSAVFAVISAQMFLTETSPWSGYAVIAVGVLSPALISGASVALAARANAPATASFFEALVIVLGVGFANLLVRLYFTDGATLLQPIGLAEAGAHSAAWLTAALLLGARPHAGDRKIRPFAIQTLSVLGFASMLAAGIHWTATYLDDPPALARPTQDALGFLLPGVLFWAHWVFWRGRGAELQTRISLGAGALSLAAALTLTTIQAENVSDWLEALVGALSFALALGVNFAPGVVAEAPARLDFEKDFHRNRRRQQRGQARQRTL